MNKKIFSLAIALIIPTSYAANVEVKMPDSKIKIYGQIGAEAASVEYANGDSNVETGSGKLNLDPTKSEFKADGDRNRQTLTADRYGSILNDGPNMIGFDFEYEKEVAGLKPYASYRTTFHTTNNSGFGPGLEAWVGLKNSNFHMKYGKLRGAYRHAKGLIDPWIYTSIQARGTGGGLSSGRYNEVDWNWNAAGQREVKQNGANNTVRVEHGRAINTFGLIHNSDISGALELGFKVGEFNTRVQIMGDDQSDRHGGNIEFKYTTSQLTVWLLGAYLDPGKNVIHFNERQDGIWGKSKYKNWKIGAQYKVMPTLKVAIQYEDADLGTFDNNPDGGEYLIGSVDFKVTNKVTIAGWVASYSSNIDQSLKMIDVDGVTSLDEDALSVSLGVKYHFTKMAHGFAGYRDTDSDNDYRDENVFSAGMLYKF